MTKKITNKAFIYGAGNIEILPSAFSQYEILGFIDDNVNLKNKKFFFEGCSIRVVGTWKEFLNSFPEKEYFIVNNISKDCRIHKEIFQKIKSAGYSVATVVHPSVYTKWAKLGEGVIIHEGVYVGPFVEIGDNVEIKYKSIIAHEVTIGKHTLISPGVIINGRVKIGEEVFIGAGATIMPGVEIGDKAVIGIGAVVLTDVPPNASVFGNPAKIIWKESSL